MGAWFERVETPSDRLARVVSPTVFEMELGLMGWGGKAKTDFSQEDMQLNQAIEDAYETWSEEGDDSVDQAIGFFLRLKRDFQRQGYGEWIV